MRNSMAISFAVFAAAVPFVTATWGNHGLWAAFTVFMSLRGLTMGLMLPKLARRVGVGPRPDGSGDGP